MTVFDADRPMRVAVLFSGGASGFRYLREHDPNYGDAYTVVVGFTDDPTAPGIEALEAADVPVEHADIRAFYDERDAGMDDLDVRAEFDAHTAETLAEYTPDVVVLSGYMWILTTPVLDRFPTINVHPADLTIVDEDGDRVYVGADPVFDAIVAGEPATRSTVHFVTSAVDAGPLVVRSPPFEVHRELVATLLEFGAEDAIQQYVDAHQEWMKWRGDGPCFATALELLADGRVDRVDGTVHIDGDPAIYDLDTGVRPPPTNAPAE
ncbi:MAG: formyltransferase family protein [Halobacteriales archaeon]|nr:formyltransferase family protein [Halobacteriales archaeon]